MTAVKCPFCRLSASQNQTDRPLVQSYECSVCGHYFIDSNLSRTLANLNRGNASLLSCTSENIRIMKEGLFAFWLPDRIDRLPTVDEHVVFRYYKEFEEQPIIHAEKPMMLLKSMAEMVSGQSPFSAVKFNLKEMYEHKIQDSSELNMWMRDLVNSEYVLSTERAGIPHVNYDTASAETFVSLPHAITPKGWTKVRELFADIDTRKVFVAMWFGNPERASIQDAIEQACKNTGWDAFTIDNVEYLGGITDEIISKINQSRFIIAEFTGNRHGVYYEAGYAEGRGLPVIYIVKKGDDSDELHFDTRHLNHITWSTVEELQTKLENRIGAVINK